MDPLFLWQVLPISLNGPIIFMAGAADKLELAHIYLWQVLPISLNWPIFFMAGAADKLKWAHYFYGRYCL
jgi:hypothetical protein